MISAMEKEKQGKLRVCPNCGATVDARSMKCSECGYAFQGVEVSAIVKNFEDKVNAANIISRSGVIKRFPVPNTEEALFAMIEYLEPLCDEDGATINPLELAAYQSKFKECMTRAKITFPKHPTVLAYNELDKQRKRKQTMRIIYALAIICAVIAAGVIAAVCLGE